MQAATPTPGTILREVREALGLTLAELARDTGLHVTTLYRIEHDRPGEASERARRLVAHALGVHSQLYGEEAA
jgi:transcriptional regulator with XRE-family HTH domain